MLTQLYLFRIELAPTCHHVNLFVYLFVCIYLFIDHGAGGGYARALLADFENAEAVSDGVGPRASEKVPAPGLENRRNLKRLE